jgi:hypothetical protein
MAAAAAAFYPSKDSPSLEIAEIDDELPVEDYITEEDVVKIFDRLFLEMQSVLQQLGAQIQQIQMSGQQIPEAQLRQLLKSEFEKALVAKQKQILEEHDVDEDCLEEATWEFLEQEAEHPKIKKAVERFQQLWENVSGESVVGKRPGKVSEETEDILDPDKLIEAAEIYFSALTACMGELVEKYKAEGKDMQSPEVAQQMQMDFSSSAQDAGSEALEKQGITHRQFQKSVEAHASKLQVGRALQQLQMKQQQALMSMGVPTS